MRAMAARITMIVMRTARAKPPTDAHMTITTNSLLLFRIPPVSEGSANIEWTSLILSCLC